MRVAENLQGRLRYLSREVQVFTTSSQALQLGGQLRTAVLAADIEEVSALSTRQAGSLLAGVNEQFRMVLRRRVAEQLAQTSAIGA